MKKWIWVVVAVIAGVIVWKRCELPVISKYLCGGGAEAALPEMPGNVSDLQQAILSPASANPQMMAQQQAGMQMLGPGGGRNPVSGAFLPTPTPVPTPNANLARIRVS